MRSNNFVQNKNINLELDEIDDEVSEHLQAN